MTQTTTRSGVRPRLVATDLDGTVVRGDGTISARTVEAFARVRDAGAEFVFATGRPPRLMGPIADAFGPFGTAICSNGALVYDMGTRSVVAEHAIDPRTLAETVRRLRAVIPGIGLAVEHATELHGDDIYEAGAWDADITVRRPGEAALWNRPAPELVGRHPHLTADELLALAAPELGDLVTVYHSNGERLVEAIAAGEQGPCPTALRGRPRHHGRGDDGLRRHAQRPPDAGLGGHVVRRRQRPPERPRRGHPRHPVQRRGRGGAGDRAPLPRLNWPGQAGVVVSAGRPPSSTGRRR
jgi:ribonucleotide monophosphatase NagD (HAD superfamily)